MHWMTTGGAGGITGAGTRPGGDQMNGNAVMYHSGLILACGGAVDYEDVPAKNAASIITLDGFAASARPTTPMTFERAFCVSVALPDGKVVTIGGMPFPIPFDDTDAVLPAGAAHCAVSSLLLPSVPQPCKNIGFMTCNPYTRHTPGGWPLTIHSQRKEVEMMAAEL